MLFFRHGDINFNCNRHVWTAFELDDIRVRVVCTQVQMPLYET